MPSYFLGIDSGTQSTKAILVQSGSGRILGSASEKYDLIPNLPEGHAEQHPQAWLKATEKSIRKVVRSAGVKASDIVGIGVSGQQHGFVPLDKNGKVIRPAKLWCDTSTISQCEEMTKKAGGQTKTISRIGNSILPGFTAPKILWLKQNEPKNFRALHTILLPHDYINYWLTGEYSMEFGDASGTALLDVKKRKWSSEVAKTIDSSILEKLPPLQDSKKPAGRLCRRTASLLGLKEGILVSAGGGDNMMGAIGTGNTKPGVVTASFGTSGTIYAYASKPVVDPQGEIAAFCDSTGAWLPLLCTMNVTVATEMIRHTFEWSHDQMTKEASKAPAGCDGLLLIPYLHGERTPNLPIATGSFFGINPKTCTKGHLARSAMEGVTMGMNYGLNRLKSLGIKPSQIRITGGGSGNRLWRQIMADIFDCEVIGMKTVEGAAYGAALQAWWCLENEKGKTSISEITDACVKTDPATRAVPDKNNVQIYKSLQRLQDQSGKEMTKLFEGRHEHVLKFSK